MLNQHVTLASKKNITNQAKIIMKKLYIATPVVIVLTAVIYYFFFTETETVNKYAFAKIEKGDLVSVVSSTGSLSAVTTIQVGTQVSGIVSKIFVDFNSQVKKGELIALIDTTFLAASLREAESSVERANAQLFQAQRELERNKTLSSKSLASEAELDQATYNYQIAKAQVKSAQSALERAKINLRYAKITAPIDGTVIARNVDVGQTVAASLSAPTLFLIANDLTKMQILANVDESDIGKIQEGQDVKFTVQAQPDKKFKGVVSQIRLQPTTIQNVVNYTVVVNVSNERGYLLPGMTATIEFITEHVEGVLKVPNAATRIRPNEEMTEIIRLAMEERLKNLPDSVKQKMAQRRQQGGNAAPNSWNGMGGGQGGGMGFGGGGATGGQRRTGASIWVLDESNKLKPVRVQFGVTDGQFTEIISEDIKEGMQVVSSILIPDEVKSTSSSPFQSNQPQQGMGGGRRNF